MRKIVAIICLFYAPYSFSSSYGGVVFSELMIDPEPTVGLPEVEYIEINNRSGKKLSLEGWKLGCGDKMYPFPVASIDSAGFSILCAKSVMSCFETQEKTVGFASFPVLVNTSQSLFILNEKNELVTFLSYTSDWQASSFKAKGGWSLECVDVNNLSGQASNWTSSTDKKGGTPGRLNSVCAKNTDQTSPACLALYVLSPTEVELVFSKVMQREKLAAIAHYAVSPEIRIASALPDEHTCLSVRLNLCKPLERGCEYDLTLSDLTDYSGFQLKKTRFKFGLPEVPEVSDLRINEILFNPSFGGCDYVELVNVSKKCIDLSQVWLSNFSETGSLNDGFRLSAKPLPCLPGDYFLLSVGVDSVLSVGSFPEVEHALNLSGFPSLPDGSGNVVLVTTSATVIDQMSYQETMHFPLLNQKEGVALEKINPTADSSLPQFWLSASAASGFGTPGRKNSQFRDWSDSTDEGFFVEKSWFSPNGDGMDDILTMGYSVAESGLARATVYDLNGRVVRDLLKNELLAAKGTLIWDGTNNAGVLVDFGRYVLVVDFFTPAGKRNKKRFVLTVLF